MSEVYMIGDLHLGHKNILKFSPTRGGSDVYEHDEWIIQQWNSVVTKRDIVYVLGDVAFSVVGLLQTSRLLGQKHLISGNHDKYGVEEYMRYFQVRSGLLSYKGVWLSHAPIHPDELRGRPNVHGHTHNYSIPDPRYYNVSVEQSNGVPVSFDTIKQELRHREVMW